MLGREEEANRNAFQSNASDCPPTQVRLPSLCKVYECMHMQDLCIEYVCNAGIYL